MPHLNGNSPNSQNSTFRCGQEDGVPNYYPGKLQDFRLDSGFKDINVPEGIKGITRSGVGGVLLCVCCGDRV